MRKRFSGIPYLKEASDREYSILPFLARTSAWTLPSHCKEGRWSLTGGLPVALRPRAMKYPVRTEPTLFRLSLFKWPNY